MSNPTQLTLHDCGGYAFPFDTDREISRGMTMRDYFAAAALQGLLADPQMHGSPNEIVACVYKYADAMLAYREQKGGAE